MGEDADADWQMGLIELGAAEARAPETTCHHSWSGWEIIWRTGDWFHPHIVERRCKKCGGIETDER